jgi:putative transposase
MSNDARKDIINDLEKSQKTIVKIICYALMPNHVHLLLKQTSDGGITTFMSKTTNSYTKYVNTKQERVGDLFQGVFKAVRVETNEQLLHVSRYIHLNPVVSYIIKDDELFTYPWSSLHDYIEDTSSFVSHHIVTDQFKTRKEYKQFVRNQIEYGKRLEEIKHLVIEH